MKKSGALGPSVWVASDGIAGNAAQSLAIARALGETSRWVMIAHINGDGHRATPIELTPKGLQPLLPSRFWWAPLKALPRAQRELFSPPWPTLWISAGRKTGPYTQKVRQDSQGQTFCVHIMNPQLPLEDFDLVVLPEHDGITGNNVIQIIGSPAYFAPEIIEETEQAFGDLADERGFRMGVILGGDSKSHKMTDTSCQILEAQLTEVAQRGSKLSIVCSRRTPATARIRFRAFAERAGARFWESPSDGPNPYLANLLFSDAVIVTEDSTNMLSEAAYFGLPIHIAKLEGHSEKFSRFHKTLVERGIARWFDGTTPVWTYEPLREIDRVADEIMKRLIARYPSPDFNMPTGVRTGGLDRRS